MRVRPKRSCSKIRVALVTLLFAGCQAAPDDGSMSALHPDRAATIEAMASELREGDPWPTIREERIETTLPGAMDAAGVEAWLVLSRENNNDPIAVHVGGEDAGRLTAAKPFARGFARSSSNTITSSRFRHPRSEWPAPGQSNAERSRRPLLRSQMGHLAATREPTWCSGGVKVMASGISSATWM